MSRAHPARFTRLLTLVPLLFPRLLVAQAEVAADSVAAPRSAYATLAGFVGDVFGISSLQELQVKLLRIAVVILIGVLAKLIMDGVQVVSRVLVFSQWGPLRYVFRNHQRSVTVHALVISLLRYVVYFTALGYILRELGIDYKTYLASLSLIGIALGFGSQGLVQDVVTGFFILFENQFSVGDMVEISGQVGLVEEIGLRTTRLRNYNGALIIFQNRNIPMAGVYRAGAMEAGVDVAIADRATADHAAELLGRAGRELHRQFEEIIMAPPEPEGLVELDTGELFVRLRARIWPLQQWVIDAQLAPRVRELFKREGVEIPADRVVTFYHLPPPAPVRPTSTLADLVGLTHLPGLGPGKD
ncbi:MAG: mechanosensitive ion channel family protein [Gemmatimonadota bacterium]